MYCYQQGYTNPADRAILSNWMGDDEAMLHPNDVVLRRELLGMADEVLALMAASPHADAPVTAATTPSPRREGNLP